MIEEAARKAQAHEFILGLEDWHGAPATTRMSASAA